MQTTCDLKNELSSCVQIGSVTGTKSNSASPTDTWLLELKNGSYVERGKMLDSKQRKLFMKIFISTDNRMVKGLIYEIFVYRLVTEILYDNGISKLFVPIIAYSTKSNINQMTKILTTNNNKQNINESLAKELIYRNMYYALTNREGRPGIFENISEIYQVPPEYKQMIEKSNFNFIATQQIKGLSFYQYLANNADMYLIYNIFQVLVACYSMTKIFLNHNDLHIGNILLEPINERGGPSYVCIELENEIYTFKATHRVRIFDFDRANCDFLSRSDFGGSTLSNPISPRTKFEKHTDFIKFITYLIGCKSNTPFVDPVLVSILTSSLCTDKAAALELIENSKKECHLDSQGFIYSEGSNVNMDAKFRNPILIIKVFKTLTEKLFNANYKQTNACNNEFKWTSIRTPVLNNRTLIAKILNLKREFSAR